MRAAWAVIAVLGGCVSNGGDETRIDLGVIADYNTGEALIEHPNLIGVGDDVLITVTTQGDGCVRYERTDVLVTGLEVAIRPYDKAQLGLCDDSLREFPHSVTVQVDEPGTATIRVFGYMAGDRFGDVIERTATLEIID